MFHRTPEKYHYQTNNIIVGHAELPYTVSGRFRGWVLPGGQRVTSREIATDYAKQMNAFMAANMKTYKRKRL